jgi:hypothetical protein
MYAIYDQKYKLINSSTQRRDSKIGVKWNRCLMYLVRFSGAHAPQSEVLLIWRYGTEPIMMPSESLNDDAIASEPIGFTFTSYP